MALHAQRVALAGGTGALGTPMLKALIEANFEVTVLTRSSGNHQFPDAAKVVSVDYANAESLKQALRGQDALISTITTSAIDQQKSLFDAAIASGVQRLIPSEFGCDIIHPKSRALPVYSQKVEMEEYLKERCKGTKSTYTFVFNNVFLDWGIDHQFLIDLKGKRVELYDGGDQCYTATPLAFVAKGTVAVLQHAEETANRAVRLHGTSLSQTRLLKIAQKVLGEQGWHVSEASTEKIEKSSYEVLKNDPGNLMGWAVGFLKRAIFADGYGGDFSANNDNALLGLEELTAKDVEEMVRSRV